MEWTDIYMGIHDVTIHVIEHDIALTLGIMFEYKKTGKLSPWLNFSSQCSTVSNDIYFN